MNSTKYRLEPDSIKKSGGGKIPNTPLPDLMSLQPAQERRDSQNMSQTRMAYFEHCDALTPSGAQRDRGSRGAEEEFGSGPPLRSHPTFQGPSRTCLSNETAPSRAPGFLLEKAWCHLLAKEADSQVRVGEGAAKHSKQKVDIPHPLPHPQGTSLESIC